MNTRALTILIVIFITALSARAADVPPVSYLKELEKDSEAVVRNVVDGVEVRSKNGQQTKVMTRTSIFSGFTATFVARTDSSNLRLFYGDKGVVIFNWEVNPSELRHADPKTGEISGLAKLGSIPRNQWVTVTWTITKTQSIVAVNGVERATFPGDYSNFRGQVGVGTYGNAVVTLRSLTIEPPRAGVAANTSEKLTKKVEVTPIEVSVPAARPKAADSTEPAAPANPDVVERPAYRERPKAIVKSLTSVTSMMIITAADGQMSGVTSDIIATVPPKSRKSDKAGAGFARPDGDPMMRTAFEEAIRAVTLRYPLWEPGHIDVSFGEKFTGHAGPSAGTAFGILLLSTLEGFEIDPGCAITGDITVDWKVRKVGGVTAKLHGAALDKRSYAAIPEANETAVADMAILFGDSSLWDIQIFSIATLQQAVALARTDRPQKLADAIKQFEALRPQMAKGGRAFLTKPATRQALKAILELAPNHLSAKYLLAMGEASFPKTLSANATLYQISVLFYPYRQLLAAGQKVDRTVLPAHITMLARKRLNLLRTIAHKDVQHLVGDVAGFIEAVDGFAGGTVAGSKVLARGEQLDAAFSAMGSDSKFMENLIREGD
jgi:hypothetical protein